MHRNGATRPAIHFVPPERVRMEPHELRTACGASVGWADWSTNLAVVSCPRCLAVCNAEQLLDPSTRPRSRH
jgi:hypothetical protein